MHIGIDIIREDFFYAVCKYFALGSLDSTSINSSLITLITEQDNP